MWHFIPGRPVGLMEKSTRYDLSSSVDNSTSITPIPFLETSVAFLSWERESIVGPQSSKELGRIQSVPAYVILLPLSSTIICYIRPKTQDKTLIIGGQSERAALLIVKVWPRPGLFTELLDVPFPAKHA